MFKFWLLTARILAIKAIKKHDLAVLDKILFVFAKILVAFDCIHDQPSRRAVAISWEWMRPCL